MNGKMRGWRSWIGAGALLMGAVAAAGTAVAVETVVKTQGLPALKPQNLTVLKTQNFSLTPPEDPTEAIPFQVRQPGTIIVEVTTTPPSGMVGVIVRQDSANAVPLRKDGPTPLRIDIPVSRNDMTKGGAWLAFPTLLGPKQNLYPFKSGAPANGKITISFTTQSAPPGGSTSGPYTPPGTPASQIPPQAAAPASGQYRVTVNGLHVNRETWDTPLQTDGKGDEIFVVVDLQEMVRDKPMGPTQTRTSLVYGDTNTFPSRIAAGSRSPKGGIKTGDSIPNVPDPWRRRIGPQQKQFPLFVWEGTLTDGQNAVLITPAVWEQDSTDKLLTIFGAAGSNINGMSLKPVKDFFTNAGNIDPVAVKRDFYGESQEQIRRTAAQMLAILNRVESVLLRQTASTAGAGRIEQVMTALGTQLALTFGEAKDRPIGMVERNGRLVFDPQVITLNYQTAEASLAQGALQKAPGILELRYVDMPKLTGDYTLYVQIERVR